MRLKGILPIFTAPALPARHLKNAHPDQKITKKILTKTKVINIIYNIPDEVYTNARIKGEPFAKLKLGHPRLFKIVKELYDYDILITAIAILITIGFTAIFIELLALCVRPISMLEIVGTIAIFLIIILLAYVQCRIEKMFEQSEPYHIRAELFKAIVYDETRIYPGYSNKKKKITDIITCINNF